jgi:hypothetical protein
MKSNSAASDDISGPAVISLSHVQDRKIADDRGKEIIGKSAWRNETQFQRACRLGQLVDKAMCVDPKAQDVEIERALDRRDAGRSFVEAWDIRDRGSKDSLDLSRGGSAASVAGISDAQIDAGNLLRSWERHVGPSSNNWMILRRVLGENCHIAKVVAEISPSYRDSSLSRFRECLDALVSASAEAAKCRRSQNGCCSGQARARRFDAE